MELDELDAFLAEMTPNEIEGYKNYRLALDTGDSELMYRKYPAYTEYPKNISHEIKEPMRIHRHERYVHKEYHSHVFLEIMYIYSGQCIQNIEGQTMMLTEGDFCIIPPGVFHTPKVFDDSILLNVLIETEALARICPAIDGTDSQLSRYLDHILYQKKHSRFMTLHPNNDRRLNYMMRELILEYYNNEKYMQEMFFTRLLSVFFLHNAASRG